MPEEKRTFLPVLMRWQASDMKYMYRFSSAYWFTTLKIGFFARLLFFFFFVCCSSSSSSSSTT